MELVQNIFESYINKLEENLNFTKGDGGSDTDYSSNSIWINLFSVGIPFLIFIIPFIYLQRKIKYEKGYIYPKDIPYRSHYPWWAPIPKVFDALTSFILMRRHGMRIFDKWMEKWGRDQKPLCRLSIGLRDSVVLAEPFLLQKVLGSVDLRLVAKPRDLYDNIFPGAFRQGLIASDVEVWQPHRKTLNKVFAFNNLPIFLRIANKQSNNLLEDILHPNEELLLQERIYSATIKIALGVVVGCHPELEAESLNIYKIFKTSKQLVVYRVLNPINFFPPVWWLNPKRIEFQNKMAELENIVGRMITICKLRIEEGKQVSKNNMHSKEEKEPFTSLVAEMIRCKASDNEIFSEVMSFIAAGQDTSVVTTGFLLQNLAEHPSIQQECQKEIDSVFQSKSPGESDFTMDDLASMKYLERCIQETLRLTPALPLIFREVAGDTVTFDNYKFPKGTVLALPIWTMHRNMEYYPDPDKFIPDRFLPENMKERPSSVFIPFAGGPRNCIGSKLAMMNMKVVAAKILRNFNVSSTDKLSSMKIVYEVNIAPEREFNLKLTKRC